MYKNIIEIASNHSGLSSRFDTYLQTVQRIPGSAIKFQIFNPDSLCHPSFKYTRDLHDICIPYNSWHNIINTFISADIDVWLEPFDEESFHFVAKNFPKQSIKIPSCDIFSLKSSNLESFANVGIATGGLTIDETFTFLSPLEGLKNIILFYGFQDFPTNLSDLNLSKLKLLISKSPWPVYYADHSSSSLADLRILFATIRMIGCVAIERHLCLNSTDRYDSVSASLPHELEYLFTHLDYHDYSSSQLHEYSSYLHAISHPCVYKDLTQAELNYRLNMQKKVILSRSLLRGDFLDLNKVKFQRSSSHDSILAFDFLSILSKSNLCLTRNVKVNDILAFSDFIESQ